MKIIVTGGRDYKDKARVFEFLDRLKPTQVVHGGCATGVDSFADQWARKRNVHCRVYKALWNKFGRSAGPLRNGEMLENEIDGLFAVVAFRGGKGTKDMVSKVLAGEAGLIDADEYWGGDSPPRGEPT